MKPTPAPPPRSDAPSTDGPPAHEPIARDVACIRCGYNLRGLPAEGRCPECGSGVLQSLRGDLLQFQHPAYVRRLAAGAALVLWGLLAMGACALGVVAALAWSPADTLSLHALLYGLVILAGALAVTGAWLVTSREPTRPANRREQALRWAVRVLTAVGLLALANLPVELALTDLRGAPVSAEAYLWIVFGGGLLRFGGVAGSVLLMVYFRRLARAIPDPALVRHTLAVTWILGTGIAIDAAETFFRDFSAASGADPAGILGCPTLILLLVGGIWWIALLLRYGRRFREQAAAARRHLESRPARPTTGGQT